MIFEIGEGFIKLVADIRFEMAQVRPMRGFGNPEGVFGGAFQFGRDLIGCKVAAGGQGFCEAFAFLVEQVAKAFQERHAEDVFLVFGTLTFPQELTRRSLRRLAGGILIRPAHVRILQFSGPILKLTHYLIPVTCFPKFAQS